MSLHRVFVLGLVLVLQGSALETVCPKSCRCDPDQMSVDCADSGLWEIPALPNHTRSLVLDDNFIQAVGAASLLPLAPRLRRLSLANNQLEGVTGTGLSSLRKLRFLDLSGNQIATISGDAFTKLSSLQKLDLSGNNLEQLRAEDFPRLPALQELLLEENSIQFLQPGTFANLPSLRRVTLANNVLSLDPVGCFPDTAMEEIDLSHNGISLVSGIREWFISNGTVNLRTLLLVNNGIQFLPRDLFFELSGLEILDLEGNKLDAIADYNFAMAPGLRELKMSNNEITDIHEDSFRTTVDLQILTLDYNGLVSFPRSLFTSTRKLTVVSAASNALEDISAILENDRFEELQQLILTSNRLEDLPSDGFNSLPSLEVLKLGDNLLKAVPNIQGLLALQVLDLSNNRITRVDTDAFRHNQELQEVHLADNYLTALDYAVVSNLPSLHILTIDGNPWWCDCRLEWMYDMMWSPDQPPWAQDLASVVTCDSPPQQTGESLEYIDVTFLREQCPDLDLGVVLPVFISIWLLVMIFLVAKLFVRKGLMAHKFEKHSRTNMDYNKRWNRRRKRAIYGTNIPRPYIPKKYKLAYRVMTFPLTRKNHCYREIDLAEYYSPAVRNEGFSETSV